MSVLAGGASSPVRAGRAMGGVPFIQARGAGAYAYDTAGRRHIDYLMAYGPLLFGHAHPALTVGLERIAAAGVCYGSTCPDEERLAARIRGHLPAMEKVRFTTTGSEAVQSAIRVARAFTGRDAVLRFAGNYHGHFDLALLDAGASAHTVSGASTGIPASIAAELRIARYNDLADVDRLIASLEDRLAAIIVEPIVGNMGLVEPLPGFLAGLLARARAAGALVIFDEVITWLRFGLAGAQGLLAHRPDMVTVGKILGGGFPIAAFGGRAEIMAVLAPDGPCFTGGTHAGNPFSVAIAHRVLDLIEGDPTLYPALDRRAARLAQGIRAILAALGLGYTVVQNASVVDFAFRPGAATRDYDEARRADRGAYAAFYHALRERGVLAPPSANEVFFLSTAHSDADIEETIAVIAAAFGDLRSRGIV